MTIDLYWVGHRQIHS